MRSVPNAIDQLSTESFVLVHGGLYPHAGYNSRVQLLTPESLVKPEFAGAAVLLPAINVAPFRSAEFDDLRRQPPIRPMPDGLLAVRRPGSLDK